MKKIITVATRQSDLALRQTEIAINHLNNVFGADFEFKILKIKTTGDKILDKNLYEIGGKSLFTKEIEEALLNGNADIAVHSMKDVTAEFTQGLQISAYLKREDPRDALISRYSSIEKIPAGGRVGTSSSRRALFVRQLRPDLEILPLRGNVITRIKTLENNDFDAIILATAGLVRLGIDNGKYHPLLAIKFIPAICQGVIGLQSREDFKYNYLITKISDFDASVTSVCEREFLKFFNADCKTPIAGFAEIKADKLYFTGMYQAPGGEGVVESAWGNISEPKILAIKVAELINSKIK
jgi:hydroxymethylbilane synthase